MEGSPRISLPTASAFPAALVSRIRTSCESVMGSSPSHAAALSGPEGLAVEGAEMKILLTSAYADPEPIRALEHCAALDRFKEHQVVDSAEDADVILFIENSHYVDDFFFRRLLAHPTLRRFPSKTLMYNEQDQPFHVIPGLYVSMTRSRFDHQRQRACCFARDLNEHFGHATGARYGCQPDRLYSFLGRGYRGVRAELLSEPHPRGLVQDTSHFNVFRSGPMATPDIDQQRMYFEAMSRGKFALCPKGVGTSTYRIYEAMSAGRAPVILADDWVPPSGPDWSTFAVFIPESNASGVQPILER